MKGWRGWKRGKGRRERRGCIGNRLLREAGVDYTDIERLVSDRDGWKNIVRVRMEHVDLWERQQGHKYEWGRREEKVERSVGRVRGNELMGYRCHWDECGKVCKSKAGLVAHERRIHRLAEDRVRFSCDRCRLELETEGARINHMATCGGGIDLGNGRRECHKCRRGYTKANYARHVRSCRGGRG